MSILEGATITQYETDNPVLSTFIGDENLSKIDILNVCEYLGIGDRTFNDDRTIDKVERVIELIGKDDLMNKMEALVSEVGFKPGMLDNIYSKLMIDKEITRQSNNLNNLLKHKYGNSNNI